jgi:hypothetical protein
MMENMAPGLGRFEQLKKLIRDDMLKLAELEMIYKATCENLDRLRYTERKILDESAD